VFERVLRESNKLVGLFWFSDDYSKIDRLEGINIIEDSDFVANCRVDPIGVHAEHGAPRHQPRGRVCFENGIIKVWVGEDNPLFDDRIIDLVKPEFNLKSLSDERFKVKRHYHWNSKGSE